MKIIKRVVCAVSGGVDSCVAALLLKKQGYQVQGVFMRNWDITNELNFCQADKDKEDAEYACRKIGIPFMEINFVKKFWNDVFSYLVEDYSNGYTPNPDIMCNKKIKFDAFLKLAFEKFNADAVATGHYAVISEDGNKGVRLLKGVDENKDQTFFLSQVSGESLKKCLFPVGKLSKDVVKKIAFNEGLEKIAKKKESTGICFIGKREFQRFIEDYIEPKPGRFVDLESGHIVGGHKGIHLWTIGQRCLIPGLSNAYYVAERNFKTKDIFVVPSTTHGALYHLTLVTEYPHWIGGCPPNLSEGVHFECEFRFQHREPLIRCLLYSEDNRHLHVLLEKPLKAITPGQFAVFYKGEECLGSSRILCRGPSAYALNKITNRESLCCEEPDCSLY